jgi:flagellum-specific ATP synthase
LIDEVLRIRPARVYGRVHGVLGMLVEIAGVQAYLSVGDRCGLVSRHGEKVLCEIVGFRDDIALAMPFGPLAGVGPGSVAEVDDAQPVVYPDDRWLGRVINAFGEPADGGPPMPQGQTACPVRNTPPPAHARGRVGAKIDVGVRVLNAFLSCCRGQRLGIFSGSGVGKSVLLSMMARLSAADVIVIGLVGERGREVKEFIEDYLGPDGLARSVVVVATSDEAALMRRQAAYLTLSVAEYFRDQGKHVLCLVDSITRFAMAQREIGLSVGEPPATKGYTPTVFAELPKLLERAGPGTGEGSITGIFTVLVEGDDHNEPVSDAVRGTVDGHVVLDRSIAQRNRFPAVDVLQSVSRTMPGCNSPAENALVDRARALMAVHHDMAELIRLGAYRSGSDPQVDEAIHFHEPLEEFQRQGPDEHTNLADGYATLAAMFGAAMPAHQSDEAVAPEGPEE